MKSIDNDNIVAQGQAEVDSESFSRVQMRCEAEVESRIAFPGDHYKDFRSNADTTVLSLDCYRLPFYEVEYVYNGKKYKVEAFACGELDVAAEIPPNDINLEALAESNTKKYKTGKIAGWSAFAGSYVFSWIMFAIGVYWTWCIPLVALATAITFHIIHNKKYSELMRSLKEDNIIQKHSELKAVLSKNEYAPLSTDETEFFNEKTGGARYAESHKKGKVLGWAIFGGVLALILLITSLIGGASANKAKLHSPEQVTIALVAKTQEYDPDASPYINGCYYIYLEYQIKAGKIGVEYIQLKTSVTDKSGKALGTITSSLDTMNLKAGEQRKYETYLQENQPQKNGFFSALYDADYGDLVFSYEILAIRFSDGEYYHGK